MVTGSLEAGGAERILAEMANFWSRKGWHVTLATWASPASEDFYSLDASIQREWLDVGGPNESLPTKLWAYVRRIRKLRRMLVNVQPEAVLSFIDTSNVMTLLACMGLRLRVVVSERVNGDAVAHLPLMWRVARIATYWRANSVVVQTRDAARWIGRLWGVRAVTIANPLRILPESEVSRESMILAIGRMTHQKGFDVLLKAFAQICNEFPDWQLVIVGQGPDQTMLRSLCEKFQLADRVQFHAPVKNIEAWLSRAYAIVIIGITFFCGLLPVIGNLISNTVIVAVSFTISPKMALAALVFLVVVHKLEYFLNSKIIGDRIKNPIWLTLLGLILGEKLMGIPGMILAPVVLYYLKVEASKIEVPVKAPENSSPSDQAAA